MFRITGALLMAVSMVLATAPVVGAHARPASLLPYFPSKHMYPRGYQLMPIRTYSDPLYLFGEADGRLAKRLHFELGSTQDAFGRNVNQVVTVTIARFGRAAEAGLFRTRMHTSVLPGKAASTRIVSGLGTGKGRYVAGICASCGSGAPPLGQLVFNRGAIIVLIGIQRADLREAIPLATTIDSRLRHSP